MAAEPAHEWSSGPGRGSPVVLLHAFPLHRAMWSGVTERLARTAPVLAVDLPGCGASPVPPGPPDLAVAADGVVALLDRLGIARAIPAGVSMGGYVALALARRHPERLAGLALIDTRATADSAEAAANRERIAAAVTGAAGVRALLPMLDTLLGATTHAERPDVLARVRDLVLGADPAGVAWCQRAMAARPDSTTVLGGLAVPAAVVVGAEDTVAPPAVSAELAAALPDAVLSVLDGAGHLSPLERPDAVADALIGLVVRTSP